uniref:ORF105 n=1 Tax=Kryptoperidinium foliaceum endosymbiont TaxID=1079369 RepID=I6N5S8_9STRA|nr:ORF105 [Kryptoperidinium foliaceum endosymbiont]
MHFILIWVSFILVLSLSEELDHEHFLLFSCSLFYAIYLYNLISPIALSLRETLLLFNVPTLILWYLVFVYNDFLCLNPISHQTFISLFIFYLYFNFYFYYKSCNS